MPQAKPLFRYKVMRMLVENEPLSAERFKAILDEHSRFIKAGGGGGRWQAVATPGEGETGLVLGVYGPRQKVDQGAQAGLMHKRLTGLDLRGVQLPYANLCGAFGQGQDLSGANLEGSLLTDSDFSRACWRGRAPQPRPALQLADQGQHPGGKRRGGHGQSRRGSSLAAVPRVHGRNMAQAE